MRKPYFVLCVLLFATIGLHVIKLVGRAALQGARAMVKARSGRPAAAAAGGEPALGAQPADGSVG